MPASSRNYLIDPPRRRRLIRDITQDTVHKIVEEANLFIDAAHKAEANYRKSMNVLSMAGV